MENSLAKSVKNTDDKERWVQVLNGAAILPPLPMNEYLSAVKKRVFAAPSCSRVHFSFLFISPT